LAAGAADFFFFGAGLRAAAGFFFLVIGKIAAILGREERESI